MLYRLWFFLALALLIPAPLWGKEGDAARKPNIIVIVGDDMGYADIGPHGCKDIPTPHLDSLAKNGIRCTSGYVSGPYCSPTRAGLLTGRYQQRFGHEFNPGPPATAGDDVGLPLSETTLAQRLKSAGYATCMVGKWHLGNGEKYRPLARGFDEFYGFLGGAHPYFDGRGNPNQPAVRGNPIMRGNETIQEKEYLTDAFRREALATIDRHKDHPFFLYLTFNAVHTPLEATQKYLDRFKEIGAPRRQTYAAMMSAMDDAIGAVLGKLRETKLEENTLIFFISDNGGPPVNGSNNGELRGFKAQTFEGGVRVPYLVQWKGKLPAGKKYDQPVIQLDIAPTALAAAGVSSDAKFDGVNLLPHLQDEKKSPPHERLYWRFGQQMAIRQGNYKLVQGPMGAKGLYDLAADIGESKDLTSDRPELAKEMQAAWEEWNKQLEKPKWGAQRANAQGGKKKKKAAE